MEYQKCNLQRNLPTHFIHPEHQAADTFQASCYSRTNNALKTIKCFERLCSSTSKKTPFEEQTSGNIKYRFPEYRTIA